MSHVKKPKLGQNFLSDIGAAEKIVDALGEIGQKLIVEIGPGQGALQWIMTNRYSASEDINL